MGGEYYDRLGVSANATREEITDAYRERLKETHPDVSDASDAGERTKRLIEAKEVLTDETERARYDRLGHNRYVRREGGERSGSDRPDHPDERSRRQANSGNATRGSTGSRAGDTGSASHRNHRQSNRTTAGGAPGGGTDRQTTDRRNRGADWGTHTGSVDWEEVSEGNWEEVSEAVWEEVTGGTASESRHTTVGWGTTASSPDSGDTATAGTTDRTREEKTGPGGDGPGGTGPTGHRPGATGGPGPGATGGPGPGATGGPAPGATNEPGPGATGGRAARGAGTGGVGGTATSGATGSTAGGAAAGVAGSEGATGRDADWSVGWYHEGDPSGTTRDAWSVGGTDRASDPWQNWTPGATHGRHGQGSFPPHRVLSPIQTTVLFCLSFLAYPLLVTGAVFPLFISPVRLLLAVCLVFVVALLIVLPQLGIVVFGAWTVLLPIAFANLGIPVLAPATLVVVGATLISLGLAVFSRLLTRPPVL